MSGRTWIVKCVTKELPIREFIDRFDHHHRLVNMQWSQEIKSRRRWPFFWLSEVYAEYRVVLTFEQEPPELEKERMLRVVDDSSPNRIYETKPNDIRMDD